MLVTGGGSARAQRQATGFACRRHVALEQEWRDTERVGDVVEAIGRVVGRKAADVDLELEQIAHRVAVFGAVQTMQERPARIGLLGGSTVERAL